MGKVLIAFCAFLLGVPFEPPADGPTTHRQFVASGQQQSPSSSSPSSGTLNLVLANNKGFVIVTDSRRSSSVAPFSCFRQTQSERCDNQDFHATSFYCDDSQKLFRTSQKSAMAIAGFASDSVFPTTLHLEIAPILRGKFGPNGLNGDTVFGVSGLPPRTSTRQVGDWVGLVLQPALTELMATRAFSTLSKQPGYKFWVTIAENPPGQAPHIRQLRFVPKGFEEFQFLHTLSTAFDVQDKEIVADHFVYVSAGLGDVATEILEGRPSGVHANPAIQKYLRRKAPDRLDKMNLKDLRALAEAILRETERKYGCWVGGEEEIGVFPTHKRIEWDIPADLPTSTASPLSILLRTGISFDENGSMPALHEDWWDQYQPPFMERDEGRVIQQFFLGDSFKGVTVRVDGNFFVSSKFESVRFLYDGGFASFRFNEIDPPCTVEIPADVPIEDYPSRPGVVGKDFPPLKTCSLVRSQRLSHDDPMTVGQELHMHWEECPPRVGGCASLLRRGVVESK